MGRIIPCTNCKQRRRKCERVNDSEPCQRCIYLKKPCIVFKPKYKTMLRNFEEEAEEEVDDLVVTDLHPSATHLCHQIDELQQQMEQLEMEIAERKRSTHASEPSWQLHCIDGKLQLQTDITCIDELVQYAYSFSRYLSPFGNTFGKKLVYERRVPGRAILLTTLEILNVQCTQKLITSSGSAAFSERFAKGIRQPIYPQHLVHQLVNAYFHCFSDSLPLLHESSFLVHFRKLQNPLKDPVTLALCTSVSLLTCKHSFFNTSEKRYIGEYFYELTINALLEIYDNHSRALEALLCINLIHSFMMTTLRINELRQWNQIASILVNSLESQLWNCSSNDLPKDKRTHIKNVIIHRNISAAKANSYIVNLLDEKRKGCLEKERETTFVVLPDESEKTKGIIYAINNLSRLRQTPLFAYVSSKLNLIHTPHEFDIDFDNIVMFENAVNGWWRTLPKDLKIVEELFDLTEETVHKCTDFKKLYIAFHTYDAILWPSGHFTYATLSREDEDQDIIRFAIKRSAHIFKYLESITFELLKQIHELDHVCFPSAKLLVRSIDFLTKLTKTKEKTISDMFQELLKKHMEQLIKWSLPDHLVPSENSPFTLISNIPPSRLKLSLNELYKDYPLTGEAIVFDVIQTTVNQLTQVKS